MTKTDKVVTVSEGATYVNKKTEDRVVAFHVEQGRVVRFSPEGRGTEDRLPLLDFLDQYELAKD